MFEALKAKRDLLAELQRLAQYRVILEKHKDVPQNSNGIFNELVALCDQISRLQDGEKGSLHVSDRVMQTYPEIAERIAEVYRYVSTFGRTTDGMNRTKQGEDVTDSKVFLGNEYGYTTNSVYKFRNSLGEAGAQIFIGQWIKPEHQAEVSKKIKTDADVVAHYMVKPMLDNAKAVGLIDEISDLSRNQKVVAKEERTR